MQKLSIAGKIAVVAVVAALIIVLAIVYFGGQNQNTAINNANSGNAAVTAASPTQTPAQTSTQPDKAGASAAPKSQTPASAAPKPPVISFITPVANDLWKINTQNLISWTKAGGITGDIYLVNATNNVFVGVILPQVGPNQTSYSWNTRDLLVNRSSPTKIIVTAGTYIARLAFDGNNLPIISSPVFTITN